MLIARAFLLACMAGCLSGAVPAVADGPGASGGSMAPVAAPSSGSGGTPAPDEVSAQGGAPTPDTAPAPASAPTPTAPGSRAGALVATASLSAELALVRRLAAAGSLPPLVRPAARVTEPPAGGEQVTRLSPRAPGGGDETAGAAGAAAASAHALPRAGADLATTLTLGLAMCAAGLAGLALSRAGARRVA